MSQERELERSLKALVDGEVNITTINKALSEASLSSDPQHFVSLIRNLLSRQEGRLTSTTTEATIPEEEGEKQELENMLDQHCRRNIVNAQASTKARSLNCSPTIELTTTPKSVLSQSVGKVRRNLSEAKSSSGRLMSDPGSRSKNRQERPPPPKVSHPVKPLQGQTSVSEPPTPRDTPTPPPITKSTSVPYSLDTSRRRRPSGNRHSSPVKKAPIEKTVATNKTPSVDLEHLLKTAEVTPSMSVTSRKHLHTSTPFHHNLNLSTVVLDNLTQNQSISPFVNPDHSINPVDLDMSTVSPDLYTSIHVNKCVPAQHATPKDSNAELEINEPYFQKLHLTENMDIKETFSSHIWNKLEIPVVHNLTFDVKTVLKISQIWIGSLEIPEEYWKNVLLINSETLFTVGAGTRVIDFPFFGKREGAFAINIALVSPGGLSSSGVVRFQVEEPNVRVLTRNGHTIDFGTVPIYAKSSVPVMLVNAGNSTLKLHLEIVTNNSIFSLSETSADKTSDFEVPGKQRDAKSDEGVAKEVRIWADLGKVAEHKEPRVYSANLLVKLGDSSSDILLGNIEILVRVCFAKLTILNNPEDFCCTSGEKCVQTVHVLCEGSMPLDVEVLAPQVNEGIFIFEKRFKVSPGVTKPVRIEFVSKPGSTGKSSTEMIFKMQPGSIVHKVAVRTNVVPRPDPAMFSENSPGLKLGVMAGLEENLDRFPVESDRSLVNWFAVEPGFFEEIEVKLRNSANTTVNLNVMIRDSDNFKIVSSNGPDTSSRLVFAPLETKIVTLIFSPKVKSDYKAKLVLKPLNLKIGGKIIKASIGLFGSGGCSDMKILDVKPSDESNYLVCFDKEAPARKEFRMANNGTAAGFVRMVCSEETGPDSSQLIISPDSFILKEGEIKTVNVSFGAGFELNVANIAVFFGPEIVRNVYRRAKVLPGAARLSGSPTLLGVDFGRKIPSEEVFTSCQYKGELTPEDVKHFYAKTEKHIIKFEFPEKGSRFGELAVEETLSESRLNATAHCHSPPTTDTVKTISGLQIIPNVVVLDQGSEVIVKILNVGSEIVHWDLNWPNSHLRCSPPAGQLARGGQAILLVNSRADCQIGPQGWKGLVEIFSDHSVDNISVAIKPKCSPVNSLLVNPSNLDFGHVALGCQDRRSLTLANPSPDLVQWKGCVDRPLFSLDQPSGLLNPGQSVNVSVTFRPVNPGPAQAVLDFMAHPVRVSTYLVIFNTIGFYTRFPWKRFVYSYHVR